MGCGLLSVLASHGRAPTLQGTLMRVGTCARARAGMQMPRDGGRRRRRGTAADAAPEGRKASTTAVSMDDGRNTEQPGAKGRGMHCRVRTCAPPGAHACLTPEAAAGPRTQGIALDLRGIRRRGVTRCARKQERGTRTHAAGGDAPALGGNPALPCYRSSGRQGDGRWGLMRLPPGYTLPLNGTIHATTARTGRYTVHRNCSGDRAHETNVSGTVEKVREKNHPHPAPTPHA